MNHQASPSDSAKCRHTARLARVVKELQELAESADSAIVKVDSCLSAASDLGVYHSTPVLGPIVLWRRDGTEASEGCYELVQAALLVDVGAAAVFWSSEDLESADELVDFPKQCAERARPLRDCPPVVRALVWPHIKPLIGRLMKRTRWRSADDLS